MQRWQIVVASIALAAALSQACNVSQTPSASSAPPQPTSTAVTAPLEPVDQNAAPPTNGVYIEVNGKPVPLFGYDLTSAYPDAPVHVLVASAPFAQGNTPTVLLQSSTVSPTDLAFQQVLFTVGPYEVGMTTASGAVSISDAARVKPLDMTMLQPGDVILSLDGQQVTKDNAASVLQIVRGPSGLSYGLAASNLPTSTDWKILRGSQDLDIRMQRNYISTEPVAFTSKTNGSLVVLVPTQPLGAGFYCISVASDINQCFQVK